MKLVLFFARHPRVSRLFNRGPVRAYAAAAVWRRLEGTPGFTEGLRRAERELAAGGGVRYSVHDLRREQ